MSQWNFCVEPIMNQQQLEQLRTRLSARLGTISNQIRSKVAVAKRTLGPNAIGDKQLFSVLESSSSILSKISSNIIGEDTSEAVDHSPNDGVPSPSSAVGLTPGMPEWELAFRQFSKDVDDLGHDLEELIAGARNEMGSENWAFLDMLDDMAKFLRHLSSVIDNGFENPPARSVTNNNQAGLLAEAGDMGDENEDIDMDEMGSVNDDDYYDSVSDDNDGSSSSPSGNVQNGSDQPPAEFVYKRSSGNLPTPASSQKMANVSTAASSSTAGTRTKSRTAFNINGHSVSVISDRSVTFATSDNRILIRAHEDSPSSSQSTEITRIDYGRLIGIVFSQIEVRFQPKEGMPTDQIHVKALTDSDIEITMPSPDANNVSQI